MARRPANGDVLESVGITRAALAYVVTAALTVIAALIVGGFVFQVSTLAFDYMKLRDLPLYGSASSLPRFSEEVELIAREMEPQASGIRKLLRDRATIDMEMADKEAAAASTLSEARTVLRPMRELDLSFRAIDGAFSKLCPEAENIAAAGQAAEISAPLAAVTASAASATPRLTAEQQAVLATACRIGAATCDQPGPQPGIRLRMICAQKAQQDTERRRSAINAYNYDSGKYFTDALRITYPSFGSEEVANAVKVTEIYQTTVHGLGGSRQDCAAERAAGLSAAPSPADTSCKPVRSLRAAFWDWWLGWPLVILYLALSFIFGLIGALSRYLYAFAAPSANPSHTPAAPIIAGGGAATLAVMLVLGGFQFLTVGASSPDLAYPNPLTVCGLSVLAGIAGERVLNALQSVVSRVFGGGSAA
jgi:hypothetical protein